ncbi:MAG: hypothetical protein WDO19_16970 [Bacteroidota bacterium]
MRIVVLFVILISSITLEAQTVLPISYMDYIHGPAFGNSPRFIAGTLDKKWSVSSYSGISTGFTFFNGGNANFISAPIGLQLNRRLNNNLFAFAGISAAPAYVNFSHSFITSDINKGNPNNSFFRSNSFGAYSRAELGLMYINDARTFSVSGSIGVERSSYPVIPYQQMNRTKSIQPNK